MTTGITVQVATVHMNTHTQTSLLTTDNPPLLIQNNSFVVVKGNVFVHPDTLVPNAPEDL